MTKAVLLFVCEIGGIMKNKSPMESFYTLVNRLYSINYSSLRISQQIRSKYSAENFKFSMPFQSSETWADAKMRDICSMRETFFVNYNNINIQNKEQYDIIDSELEKSKEYLLYVYNVIFGKESSFEDVFDGFLCKAPDLLGYIYMFEMQPCITNNPDIKYLVDAYTTYMSNLFYKTTIKSMQDLISQLNNDFNSSGAPSLYKGIIQNEDVLKISAEKLSEIRKQVEDLYKQVKAVKTKKYSGKAYTQAMAMSKYAQLDLFLKQLESRLKSANEDVVNNLPNRVVEETMDFLTGFKLDKKPEVSEIYVTKLEMSYVKYLKEMISFALEVLKENESRKEKGDA